MISSNAQFREFVKEHEQHSINEISKLYDLNINGAADV